MNVPYTFAAAAALILASQTPVLAETVCNDATIAGTYATHGQGWDGLTFPFLPESVVAIRTFDGKGKFTGSGHQSIAGIPRSFSITGTYSVAANCTVTIEGTATTSPPIPGPTPEPDVIVVTGLRHWFGVIVDAGNTIYATSTDRGVTTNTEFHRIVPID